MYSLLKSSGKLSGLSTVLKVSNGTHFTKLDDLHHLQETTNSWDLSFNDKTAVDEKSLILAYLASVLKESTFFHFDPTDGNR
ncbi:hypothetical protein Nepgr_012694 [Nepenthes gracilis]|uniref:Uncharacterized protein n=1 Tax=Nepenthes gracilis TaxID=150966 RepID=A0AAD3SGG3_NEPGR|nr:hypothetical protein Nepgr_012694 [Nepenthes gracilis]